MKLEPEEQFEAAPEEQFEAAPEEQFEAAPEEQFEAEPEEQVEVEPEYASRISEREKEAKADEASELRGYLHKMKRTKVMLSVWNKRWFVINGRMLHYFKSEKHAGRAVPSGSLNLSKVNIVRHYCFDESSGEISYGGKNAYGSRTFMLQTTSDRKLVLRAPSKTIARVWVDAIRKLAPLINAEEKAYDTPLEEEDNFEHEDYEHHQDRGEVEAQEGKSDDDRAEKDAFYSPALPTMVQSARRDDDQSSQASSTWGSTRSAPAGHATLSQSRLFSYCRHNRYLELQYHLHSGKDVNIRDRHGNTLLMIACQNNLRSMTKLLLRCGADMDLQNDKGNTALHYAFGYGYGQTLGAYLLKKGADPQVRNIYGATCLDGIGGSKGFLVK